MKSTFMEKKETVKRNWYVIDATDVTLGRLCTKVANLLTGKGKVTYTPHIDCGDYVIVVNANKVNLTGKKLTDKKYYNLTGGVVTWVDSIDNATEYTSDAQGAVTAFKGLANGTYTLIEKTVPAGYNKAADSTFTVAEGDYTTTNLEQTATVKNESGSELPSTGCIGTTVIAGVDCFQNAQVERCLRQTVDTDGHLFDAVRRTNQIS